MSATIERLFEVLIGPPILGEADIARVLGLELAELRPRLWDLKRRGILRGPFEEGEARTWKSWFPTLAGTIEAGERSGLRKTSALLVRRSWWNARTVD